VVSVSLSGVVLQNTPPGSMIDTPPTHHVTRVKATATVKVEVHTPLPGKNENKYPQIKFLKYLQTCTL